MTIIKFYGAQNCSSCQKAFNFLVNHRYPVERIDIFAKPPTRKEMEEMLEFNGGNLRALFNTAGRVYQENNIKEKIVTMTKEQAFDMLAKNGRLVKRPFVLLEKDGKKMGLVGFDPKVWKKALE
jgi:arsenate reductase (glutaredoxin)